MVICILVKEELLCNFNETNIQINYIDIFQQKEKERKLVHNNKAIYEKSFPFSVQR